MNILVFGIRNRYPKNFGLLPYCTTEKKVIFGPINNHVSSQKLDYPLVKAEAWDSKERDEEYTAEEMIYAVNSWRRTHEAYNREYKESSKK